MSVGPEGYHYLTTRLMKIAPLIVEKGSIALDGISLTLARVAGSRFAIAVIPFTWEHTNLSDRKPGDRVNVEADILGKQVLRALAYMKESGASAAR